MGHCVLANIFAHRLNSVLLVKSQQGEYDVTDKWHTYMPFELRCWRRLLRVPWTARRSNQSILNEINPEYSLEGLLLKLYYLGDLMWRVDSLEKILMLGKIEGRRRGRQRMRWLDGIPDSMDMNLSKLLEMMKDREAWHAAVHRGHKESDMTEWLNNSNKFKIIHFCYYSKV